MYAAQTKHTLENLGITRKYKGFYYLSDAVEIVNLNETAGRLKGISAPLS